jgi:hypothetical protein
MLPIFLATWSNPIPLKILKNGATLCFGIGLGSGLFALIILAMR